MDAKVVNFQCNFFRLMAVALLFRRAGVKWSSSSGNANYTSGQTDRILVPYKSRSIAEPLFWHQDLAYLSEKETRWHRF
jgi:hypothetical protein